MFRFIIHTARLIRTTYTLSCYRLLTPLSEIRMGKPLVSLLYLMTPNYSKHTTAGKRLSNALSKLGPSFIKLGQTLSARPDIVGEEICKELSLLQDKLPPFDAAIAITEVENELDKSLEELYQSFDRESVAAASIAQVHKATTLDGKEVAVKIMRPDIEKTFGRDIDFLMWMARIVEWVIPYTKRLKPVSVVETFAESVKMELDFRFEAAAASELKDNLQKDQGIYIPTIDWQRTSRRVLTIEWVNGIPIHDTDALQQAGHNLTDISHKLAVNFFNQAYRDGFFHADMHPGNVFVNQRGDIVPIDYGIMGRLDQKNRLAVAGILQGFLTRDYTKTAQVHIDAGYVPFNTPVALFAQACRSIGEPIVGLSARNISIARLLAQLFKITEDFSMETQPQLLLLQKTLVLVEGIGTKLNPEVNMWELAEPWIKKWAVKNIGPEAEIKRHLEETVKSIRDFPLLLQHATHFLAMLDIKSDSSQADAPIPILQRRPLNIWKIGSICFIASFLALIVVKSVF